MQIDVQFTDLDIPRVCFFFCRWAKHHTFQSFAVKSAVSISKVPCRCFYRDCQISSWQKSLFGRGKSPFGREKSPFQNLDLA